MRSECAPYGLLRPQRLIGSGLSKFCEACVNDMKAILTILGAFPILVALAAFLRPDLLFGEYGLDATLSWNVVGALFGYLGFLFSVFAVMEVRSLSNRYFAKQRLPDFKKQLEKITKNMTSLSSSKLGDLRTERFMSETAVVIRQITKTKVSGFSAVTKKAKTFHSEVQAKLRDESSSDEIANDLIPYWNLFSALNELADEIDAYDKGAQASL